MSMVKITLRFEISYQGKGVVGRFSEGTCSISSRARRTRARSDCGGRGAMLRMNRSSDFAHQTLIGQVDSPQLNSQFRQAAPPCYLRSRILPGTIFRV